MERQDYERTGGKHRQRDKYERPKREFVDKWRVMEINNYQLFKS